ncbi:MAG: tRNA (adenosine(37)-N6)-threonylcarbamoyltransferase complex dimerization subunit type 1 TsaB [Alphaproteobacteria bacterium]|nr:tRNA (adenosine(37)-N6)-threonylcarbamoyltransferase complex dimerization subunit type 1 TsaB [Alphaproteobacteria bacterium]MCB9928067.1 tRNA (adenosine(37)-N6)-threonylcarbamoyltransferase complex dimerization subunit type 1 TsaB [Alphaproteobacteria bacterium]
MKILAFDTAGPALSVAVTHDARVIAALHQPLERGHAECLLPAIQGVLVAAGLRLSDLSAIATTVGPGSFTGLRTGLAAAQGLSIGAGLPVVGVSRFEALAEASGRLGHAPVAVAMDSRARTLYLQAFAADGAVAEGWPADGHNRAPDAMSDLPWPDGAAVIGDGAPSVLAAGAPLLDTDRRQLPAAAVAACARRTLLAGGSGLPAQPLYLAPPRAVRPRDGGRIRPR